MGRRVKFILIIKALNIFLKELNMRQRKWLELIKDYDCTITTQEGQCGGRLPKFYKKFIEAFEHLELEVKILGKRNEVSQGREGATKVRFKNLDSQGSRTKEKNSAGGLQLKVFYPSRRYENVPRFKGVLLVA